MKRVFVLSVLLGLAVPAFSQPRVIEIRLSPGERLIGILNPTGATPGKIFSDYSAGSNGEGKISLIGQLRTASGSAGQHRPSLAVPVRNTAEFRLAKGDHLVIVRALPSAKKIMAHVILDFAAPAGMEFIGSLHAQLP